MGRKTYSDSIYKLSYRDDKSNNKNRNGRPKHKFFKLSGEKNAKVSSNYGD